MRQRDTAQEQNLALVRRFCQARADNDPEAIVGCLAEDVVWRYPGLYPGRYPGRNPLSGEYRGRGEVAGFFRRLRELTGGDSSSETERIMADGTSAFAHEKPRGTRGGRSLAWRTVLVLGPRGGEIAEVEVFQNIQHEFDEWWSS